ncbi:MAG: PepSY domain-containing protein [Gammaproteobacteria bacterium]
MGAKLHKWHRRIGLLASAFIIFLVSTGIVLQHSDELGLPTKHLASGWLLNYYGIKPNPITTYQLGNQTISHAGYNLYLSGRPIVENVNNLFGVIYLDNQIIIATSNSLIVIDHDGNLFDEITKLDGLVESPLGISKSADQTLILRGITKYWESKNDLYNWQEYNGAHPKWATPSITLPALRQVIEAHDMSQQISLERFLLDAHSGRIFGKYGIYIIDVAAILLMVLASTGIWLWFARR